MRALSLLIWLALIAVVVILLWRRRPPDESRDAGVVDDLVKDPVCQTYVVRSRAVRRIGAGAPQYFCSVQCAERYDAPPR
jgi:YHS domain-containing protein